MSVQKKGKNKGSGSQYGTYKKSRTSNRFRPPKMDEGYQVVEGHDKYQSALGNFIHDCGGQVKAANLIGINQSLMSGYLNLVHGNYLPAAHAVSIEEVTNGIYMRYEFNPVFTEGGYQGGWHGNDD